jgi:NitT/TauT family transport system substrate-binding protein
MKTPMTRSACVVTALALFAYRGAAPASAADMLKLAAGQREIWHGAPAALGQRAGIFKKHNLELELLFTSGAGETIQAVVSGSVHIGVGAGTLGVMGAYARGASIRVIGAESTGDDAYWFVPALSPVRSMADMKGRTIGYSTTGSSTHASVLGLIDLYKVDAKPTATGGFPATFTQVMSGQIDAGWSAPPYAMQALRQGDIRVIARSIELALIKDHTVRTIIANKPSLDSNPDLYRRFMRAYKETIDWMYSDDEALRIYAGFANISMEDARRIRDEFDPKDMVNPDRVVGLADVVADALKFKFLSQPLTEMQLRELVQIPK